MPASGREERGEGRDVARVVEVRPTFKTVRTRRVRFLVNDGRGHYVRHFPIQPLNRGVEGVRGLP